MGIRIEKKIMAYESITCTAIDPSYLSLDEDTIRKYLRENLMPEDKLYTEEDLILDLTQSEGVYTLPEGIKEETIEYIEELLNKLV
jgi:hypothetical protein